VKRREQLEKVKFIHQFVRDVEDEKLWIEEKMPQATSKDFGNSLLTVQLLEKKNQVGVEVVIVMILNMKFNVIKNFSQLICDRFSII
jgi:hypothetical protein